MVSKRERQGERWIGGLGLAYTHYGIWNGWSMGIFLYSRGKSTQYSMTTYMGMDMCRCITESLSCTAEINTTLSINYTSIKLGKKDTDNTRMLIFIIKYCLN